MTKPFSVTATEQEHLRVESKICGTYWIPYSRVKHVWLDTTGTLIYVKTESVTIILNGSDLKEAGEWIIKKKVIEVKELTTGLTKEPSVTKIKIEENK